MQADFDILFGLHCGIEFRYRKNDNSWERQKHVAVPHPKGKRGASKDFRPVEMTKANLWLFAIPRLAPIGVGAQNFAVCNESLYATLPE